MYYIHMYYYYGTTTTTVRHTAYGNEDEMRKVKPKVKSCAFNAFFFYTPCHLSLIESSLDLDILRGTDLSRALVLVILRYTRD